MNFARWKYLSEKKRPYSERMSLLCLVHCSQNRLVNPVENKIFYFYLLSIFYIV
jgi:hypothetical protein